MILYGIFSSTVKGGYEAKIADSQKHPSCFATYEDLAKNIKNALINKNYEVCTEEKEFEFGHISLYVERESRISTTSVWITLRLLSIESDIWEDLQKAIMAEIDTCCGFAAGKLELTVLLCVDRVSTNFYKTINKEIRQHDNFTWLLAGVSFGGKIIYVAQQHGGVSYKKYKQLRSHFLDVMQISTDRNEIEQK